MNQTQFLHWLQNTKRTPIIMGILNLTPDSFSDGNHFLQPDKALFRVQEMIAQGVDLIDIGGESSRPDAIPVSTQEELDRVIPIIEKINAEFDICLSIDTTKPEVMDAAVGFGAGLINDISALSTYKSRSTAKKLDVPVCLMHMQHTPQTMQIRPHYNHLLDDINEFFNNRISDCLTAGIRREYIILDPGFGFGKTVEQNLQLIHRLDQFKHYKMPLLIGVSRKSTLGVLLNKAVTARLVGGLTLGIVAILKGAAIIRTHDIGETKDAIIMLNAFHELDLQVE